MSDEVKDFLKTEVPSKKILKVEHLPLINIESYAILNHDIGIQNDKKREIYLAIEENKQHFYPQEELKEEVDEEESQYGTEEIDYAFNLLKEDEEESKESQYGTEEIDYAFNLLKEDEEEDSSEELQRMIDQLEPEDSLPTPSEEAELFAMADD